MTRKINYTSDWIDLSKAVSLFSSIDSLVLAASEGKIKTRGRVSTSGEPDTPYTEIENNIWENCFYNRNDFSLEDVGDQADEGYLLNFVSIQVKREDLISWIISQRHSGISNELQETIKSKYLKLYLSKLGGSYPSATEVLQEIESDMTNIHCIRKIDRPVGKEVSIWWTTADGQNTGMTFGRFKNLITDIKKVITEIENHT
ncbi:MAG: hypothetical protein NZ828_05710 [Alphaproteobacteria bacterium]|nr:hypothetical protein [Alphaproteobacteria bacterium]